MFTDKYTGLYDGVGFTKNNLEHDYILQRMDIKTDNTW